MSILEKLGIQELPELPVSLDRDSIVFTAGMLILVALIVLLSAKLIKQL